MNIINKFSVFLLLIFILTCPVFGEYTGGQNSALFLALTPDASVSGLAGASQPVQEGISSVYGNPAGLKFIKNKYQFSAGHLFYYEGVNYTSLNMTYLSETLGPFSGAFNFVHYGSFTSMDNNGNKIGEFSAYALNFIGGYAMGFLKDKILAGARLKVFSEKIEEESATSFAVDLGMNYDPGIENLKLGAYLENAGQGLSFIEESYSLPFLFKIGGSYGFPAISLFPYLNLCFGAGGNSFFSLGVEYRLMQLLAFRMGYKAKGEGVGAISGLGMGLGIKYSFIRFDYSVAPGGDLNYIHRIGLGANF